MATIATKSKAAESWCGADLRDVLIRLPFGCCWILDRAVELAGPIILPASSLGGQRLIDYAAADLAKRYGPAVLNTTATRIIPVVTEPDDNGDVGYFELVPPSLPSDGFEELAHVWDTLRAQIEYRAARVSVVAADERLDDCERSGDLGNEGARSRIVKFLKGARGLVCDDSFTMTIGDVLDALDAACVAAGVPILKPSPADAEPSDRVAEEADATRRCPPMSRTEILSRASGKATVRPRDWSQWLDRHDLRHEAGTRYTISMDSLDAETRERLLRPR